MANTKLTKKEKFNMVLALIPTENTELVDFIKHEIELLEKKANGSDKAKAKKNAETEKAKAELLKAMVELGKPITVTGFLAESKADITKLSASKITSLLTALKNEGKVVRAEIKKRPYYSVATEVAEDMGE